MFPSRRITTLGGDIYRDQYSLAFDGTNDYLDLGTDSSLDINPFTISAWVKADSTSEGIIYGSYNNSENYTQFRINTAEIQIYGRASNDLWKATTTSTISTGQWYLIVATCESGAVVPKVYIDGSLMATDDEGSPDVTGQRLGHGASAIGRWHSGDARPFTGNISEVGIWSVALSAGQVATLYNGREPFDARNVASGNLVSYWRMGDGVLDHRITNGLVADQITATLGGELVTNGGMEIDDNWVDFNTPTVNAQSQEQAYPDGGSYSWKFTTDGNDGIKQTGISVVAGKLYRFTYWVYPVGNTTIGTALNDGAWQLDAGTTGLTADTWNEVTHYVKAGNSSPAYIIINDRSSATGTWYIDSVSIKLVNGNAGSLVNFDGTDFKTDVPK